MILNTLARFQPDYIKIDMKLIRSIATSLARQTIIASVMTMARDLVVVVIAEEIETDAELTTLRAAGVTLFQGHLFAKPAIANLPRVQFLASDSTISMEAGRQQVA
jgi:EAL domain-containing protein (putative c-di-GMP-specific phosphodiesterase class I)